MYLNVEIFWDCAKLDSTAEWHLTPASHLEKQTTQENDDSNCERDGTTVNPLAVLVHERGGRPDDSETLQSEDYSGEGHEKANDNKRD
jgi:hypothetical protein